MENIENNNAVDYIPALIAVQHRPHQHHGTELIVENEIRVSSSSSSVAAALPHHTLDCQSPPQQLTSTSITETNFIHPDTNQITSPEECSLTSVSILMPPDESFLDPFDDVNFNVSKDDVEDIMLRDKVEITCEKNPFNKYLIEHQISEDNTSVSSISTGSTPEINSVEEALRALDIAIEGEDVSPDEPLHCQEFSPDELLDVIVQGIKNDCLEMSNKLATYPTISDDIVREEAQMLVDDVLGKAQQLYEVLTTHKSLDLPKETTLIDEPKDEFVFPKPISTVPVVATLKSQLTIEQDDDPFESFSSQILDSTSTPAFGYKTTRHEHSGANPAVQKLNFDDESSPVIANDCTFDVSMPPVAGNATFEVPKQQQHHPCNSPPLIRVENRDMDANSDELLPTITPVNTPNELNFPTETWNKIVAKNLMKNRPADADLDLVPANIVFDRTFDKTFDNTNTELIDTDAENVGGGWFLHPQLVPKFNDLATTSTQQQDDILAGGDATFDVPEDGDDFNADFRDKNIEALRMHLTATLGHGGPGFGSAAEGNQEHSDDDEDLSGPIER